MRWFPLRLPNHFTPLASICLVLASGWAHGQETTVPGPADDQFREGLYQRETGRPYAAIETLESLLAANPTLNRARLELAVAYYRTLGFAKAREQAQKVLDDPKTPDAVKLSVLSFLKQIELDEANTFGRAHRFEPSVSLGLVWDSNVSAGPDSPLLPFGFSLDNASAKHSDWGTIVQAGLTHTAMSSQPLRIGQSTARLSWVSSLSGYRRAYDTWGQYNLSVFTLATGPAIQFQGGDRGNLNLQMDTLEFGGRFLGQYFSASPSYTWKLGRGELSVDGQLMHRDFQRSNDAGRDSYYRSLGVSYGHLLRGGSLALQGGVRVFNESAREDRFTNDGQEVFVGARLRAWQNGDLFARASWRHTEYDGVEPIYAESRSEIERRLELGASHLFSEGWLDKWQLSGTATLIKNAANLGLYEYDRTLATVTFGRGF
ncbi:MAG: hypothetical protein EPO12_02575 [Aquabacterium sp.]|jgi:hypothetical protein|nr:MAG: hypothetical protein EPO12_02575 [Aquabacterium sp.]